MQMKSYPEPRYIKQRYGELFCLRASSELAQLPTPFVVSPRTPEATPRTLWGSAKQLENHWPSLSWASQRPHPTPLLAADWLWVSAISKLTHPVAHAATTSPVNTIRKCSPLSKAKVWTKTPEANLVPHSSLVAVWPHSGTKWKSPGSVNCGQATLTVA